MARELVMAVLKVELRVMLVSPFKLLVLAQGQVPTGGWHEGRLQALDLKDGELTYEFTAERPSGRVLQVISDIQGKALYADDPDLVKRVTVKAANNSVTVARGVGGTAAKLMDDRFVPFPWRSIATFNTAEGNGTTWPFSGGGGTTWPFKEGGQAQSASMAGASGCCPQQGMLLRVMRPGEVGTTDWNPNRVNIHIDGDGIIEDITCG